MAHRYIKFGFWGIIALSLILAFSTRGSAFSPHDEAKDLPAETKVLEPVHTNAISSLKTFDAFQDIGQQSGQSSIEAAVRTYLENNPSVLGGLTLSDLRFKEIRKYKLPYKDMYYIDYVQQKNGFDVEFSYVNVSASRLPKGETLIHVNAKVFPQVNEMLDATQPVPTEQAVDAASQAIGLEADKPLYREKKIISLDENNALQLKTLLTFEDDPHWTVVIGPTGVEGVRSNVLHATPPPPTPPATVSGTMQGRGYRFFTSPQQPLDVLPLPNVDVSLNTLASITDRTGMFNFINQPAGNVSGRLRGPYVDVINAQGTNLSFSTFVPQNTPTTITVNPTGNNEFDIAQVNAFHHVNLIHDWVKERTGFTGIDIRLPVTVNQTWGWCNASYTGFDPFNTTSPAFTFFASEPLSGCQNAAYDTLIYHEYTHFVDDRAGGIVLPSTEARGLTEGWADTLAAYISGQPILMQVDPYAQSADNEVLYPSNALNEIHYLGQSLSGFAWDLRRNIIARYSRPDIAERLVLASIMANVSSIPDAVESIILADDDDNNLNNGTPNFNEIRTAAEKHHLYPIIKPASAQITAPIRNVAAFSAATPQMTITGTANAGAFASYQLSYGMGESPSNWTNITPAVITPVTNGTLGTWTLPTAPGVYMLRLVVNTTTSILKYQYLVPVNINVPWVPFFISANDSLMPRTNGQSVIWFEENSWIPNNSQLPNMSMKIWENGNTLTLPFTVQPNPEFEDSSEVKMSGSKIFLGIYNGNSGFGRIDIYDRTSGSSSMPGGKDFDVSGNLVAAARTVGNSWIPQYSQYIDVRDIVTNQITAIGSSSEAVIRRNVAISGRSLVYEKYNPVTKDSDIYLYDLNTNNERQITNDPSAQTRPDIDGNWIVYEDKRHGNVEIYAYNLTTSTEQRISNSVRHSIKPKISGDIIVWTEIQESSSPNIPLHWQRIDSDIWQHKLTANQSAQVNAGFGGTNYNPDIAAVPGTPFKIIVGQSTVGGGVTQGQLWTDPVGMQQGLFRKEGCNIFGMLVQ